MSVMSQHHARLWGDDRQSLRVSSQGLGGAHVHPDALLWGRRKMCGPADFPASLRHYVVISEVLLNFPQMQSFPRKDAVSCAPLWECPGASLVFSYSVWKHGFCRTHLSWSSHGPGCVRAGHRSTCVYLPKPFHNTVVEL